MDIKQYIKDAYKEIRKERFLSIGDIIKASINSDILYYFLLKGCKEIVSDTEKKSCSDAGFHTAFSVCLNPFNAITIDGSQDYRRRWITICGHYADHISSGTIYSIKEKTIHGYWSRAMYLSTWTSDSTSFGAIVIDRNRAFNYFRCGFYSAEGSDGSQYPRIFLNYVPTLNNASDVIYIWVDDTTGYLKAKYDYIQSNISHIVINAIVKASGQVE